MAEQNFVKMGDAEEVKATSQRRVSDIVAVTMRIAVERLSGIDRDPILREAIGRMGVRDFARALQEFFPDQEKQVPEYLMAVAAEAASGEQDKQIRSATLRMTGGSADAEHRKSSGKAGG